MRGDLAFLALSELVTSDREHFEAVIANRTPLVRTKHRAAVGAGLPVKELLAVIEVEELKRGRPGVEIVKLELLGPQYPAIWGTTLANIHKDARWWIKRKAIPTLLVGAQACLLHSVSNPALKLIQGGAA